ncbi:EcoAI/FtnUII family type I restriction enzme subunit R [Actinobacillus equuli]|uniref:EcoAI/FtnUII family type I restriction enzme subunit R n=1 Tax=Actinobacillus equuli TaxID=718 RepID=UPI002442CDC8|nr:DEAD/DEAH box helicase family protein [Actinobacillus equuli]WGE42095.1 DEAD/DEAH box helicase family protein [Actinobacillus equuli subsp. haemolyticus]WGE52809.1 DEAD/DEAH box helicase family protein [Actinobacillus equuli subsp. haemolyticus]WGE73252.1 DEAD/DEAH box helicase family protein [Actinobacillus equuli subsp. haemolyticus]
MFSTEEKRQMTEADIRSKFITPAIRDAGWSDRQISEEFSFKADKQFTDGQMIVDPQTKKASRKEAKRADYILYQSSNHKIAVVEAKDNKHSARDGLQQAMDYALLLDIPFAYSSNGDEFIEHDFITGKQRQLPIAQFPTPQELAERWSKQYTSEELKIIQQPYYTSASDQFKEPRYYQEIAINRTIEAVAKGQNRILLVMATGTGKTYTAFQIIHRLKACGAKRKVLFLADRNVLVDQPMTQDFKPFKDKMIKVSNKKLDSSFEVYLALYQQLDGETDNELFKQFQPSFFDLIIIDECHRGSAKEDSNWRAILNYFSEATHIGMTATPKETADASNISYFGDPIYTYSLKQGIEDGFLAPYRVIRVDLDCDLKGWRPTKGLTDKNGELIEDRIYTIKDFDYNIVLDDRTRLVAERITEFLHKTNRLDKTIVFCANINHAQRMVAELSHLNADMLAKNPKYIRQITGDQTGKNDDLEAFCDVKNEGNAYPVIAVTSKLMTTGVDSKTCKLVVLDANIQSMTEFKQIIGRGTRLRTDAGKEFFTILDFRGVTRLFADPAFDGEPVAIIDIDPDKPISDSEDQPTPKPKDPNKVKEDEGKYKPVIVVEVGSLKLRILDEKVQYLNEQGELVSEDIDIFSQREIRKDFSSYEQFQQSWVTSGEIFSKFYTDEKWLSSLRKKNQFDSQFDDYDVIRKVAYGKMPMTKQERSEKAKQSDYLAQYPEENRQVLGLLLDEYAKSGSKDLSKPELLKNNQFEPFGGLVSIVKKFGGKALYQKAVKGLEKMIYSD